MSTSTVTPAAPVAAPVENAEVELHIPAEGTKEYHDWRMGGKVSSSAREESAPSSEEKPESVTKEMPSTEASAPSSEAKPVIAAESGTASTQEKDKGKLNAEARKEQLNSEIRELIRKRDQLLQPVESVKQESRPADPAKVAKEPTANDVDEKGQLKYAGPDGWNKLQADIRTFDRERILTEVKAQQVKEAQQQRSAEAERLISQVWQKRVTEARTKHPDFDAVAFGKADDGQFKLHIAQGSVPDAFIADSEVGPEVLYHLATNPADAERILGRNPDGKYKLNPLHQARELLKLEFQLSTPAEAPATPAKKITQAPPPPHQVGGKGTVAPDELESAVKDDDFESYSKAANRRDIASRKGK